MDLKRTNTYIESLFTREDMVTREKFVSDTRQQDFIPVVEDDVARFLKVVVRLCQPRRILEIGTSIGFSTYSMATIAKEYGGRVTTIEFDPLVADQAKSNFIRLGVDDVIDLYLGDALEIVPTLEPPYDLIFQDADKNLYPRLLPDCLRLMAPGGLLLAEDVLFPVIDLDPKWQDLITPISQFNRIVAECVELESTILPIGDGVLFAVKR